MSARSRSRLFAAGVAVALLALTAVPVAAQDASPSPAPSAPPIAVPYDDSTALPAVPTPGAITDPAAVGWDHVTIWPDGKTLTVSFWNGAEGCFGLDRIEVIDTGAGIQVTPFVGFRADATNRRCIAVMQLYSTVVELPAPILGGGHPGIAGAGTLEAGQPIAPGAPLMAVEPQPWDAVTVAADGVSASVHFTGGVTDCYGLGRVDTPVQDGLQLIVVFYGHLANPAGGQTVCVSMAVFYWTPVTLPAPILLGGAL